MTRSLHFHSKPKRKRPEARLQKIVVDHLRQIGAPGMLFFSIPNEGDRTAGQCVELIRMGMRPGAADLCIIVHGHAHFLELKSLDGEQGAKQVGFQMSCFDANCPYEIANSIDAALRVLSSWGALRVARKAA